MMKKDHKEKTENEIFEGIKSLCSGLYYMSETDAEILPFVGGKVKKLTREKFAEEIGVTDHSKIEERDFDSFFKRLVEIKDWFGEEEKKMAKRFSELRDFLIQNLSDLRVFRIGRIEIDIYVVGIDRAGKIVGFKTKAVET
jgi:hypothetical protein